MSDMPWAVAWYGQSQSIWATVNPDADFFAINDYLKSIQALYLTSNTTDTKFSSQFYGGAKQNWGGFIMGCLMRREQKQNGPPASFPLQWWHGRLLSPQGAAVGQWPDMFLLTARAQRARSSLTPASENSAESAFHFP
jgi:hypothetical protein